jgi:hypothetical protein
VLRPHIPPSEAVVGAVILASLTATGIWLATRGDDFDPTERDVSTAAMAAASVADTLYKAPLARWVEPGSATTASPTLDLGLLPPAILADGWTADGRLERYTPATLYEKINGAAEQYLSFGFQALSYLTIAHGEHLMTLEIYDQGRFENTLGLFAAQRSSGRPVVTDGSLFYYLTPVGAVGGTGRYYFKLAGNSEAPAIAAKAGQVVAALAPLGAATDSVPRGFTVLSGGLGLPFDRLAYQPTDAFQYSFANDFWFATPEGCGDCRVFLHQAADEPAAAALSARLVGEQEVEYTVVERGERETTLQHRFLATIFAVRQEGPLVYGVDGAPDRASAERWLSRLEEAVRRAQA